jgi:hypothetical protein
MRQIEGQSIKNQNSIYLKQRLFDQNKSVLLTPIDTDNYMTCQEKTKA